MQRECSKKRNSFIEKKYLVLLFTGKIQYLTCYPMQRKILTWTESSNQNFCNHMKYMFKIQKFDKHDSIFFKF